MDPLEKLYQNYNVLSDAKDEIAKFENHYVEILEAAKGSSTEKRLASQFICNFYKDFPNLHEQAMNSLFDLCEDEEVEIRKQVIKDLPSICKDNQENVVKITDILLQMLVDDESSDDHTEMQIIHISLINLCKISPKCFLTGLFQQIDDDSMKEKVIQFLHSKIKTLPDEFWSKENEEFFLTECKKILIGSTRERFAILMSIISNLKISKRINGQQILLDIVNQNANLELDINPEDKEQLENFQFYLKYAVGCFSHFVPSNQYVNFICSKIITRHQQFVVEEENQVQENFAILPILQALGEITAYLQPTITTQPIDLVQCEKIVFNKLLLYLPEVKADGSSVEYKYDYLEPLMFAFHNLGKKDNEAIINNIGGDEVLKEFKKRLQQLGLQCQDRIKNLQASIRSIKDVPTSPKAVAMKCVQNLQAIIKDMFYLKPVFKVSLAASWKFSSGTVINLNKVTSHTTESVQPATNGNGVSSESNNQGDQKNNTRYKT